MEGDVLVKPEPMGLVEDEKVLPRSKAEHVPAPITFPYVKREFVARDIVSCKQHPEEKHAQVKDEAILTDEACDRIEEELKTEIDIEEYCILGNSSEFVQNWNISGHTNLFEDERIIVPSTNEIEGIERDALESEEQVIVDGDIQLDRKVSSKKLSQNVDQSLSMCSPASATEFKCDICGKYFRKYSQIVNHIRYHMSGRLFKCNECTKCFIASSNLRNHMRLHTGDKPFKCSECCKYFTQSNGLKRHMMLHTGEKPFKCKECSKCFTQSGQLKEHMMLHRGDTPFMCKECSRCFTRSESLKVHMRLHTGEKPFKCNECSKCFTWSNSLKHHMMLHMREKPFKC